MGGGPTTLWHHTIPTSPRCWSSRLHAEPTPSESMRRQVLCSLMISQKQIALWVSRAAVPSHYLRPFSLCNLKLCDLIYCCISSCDITWHVPHDLTWHHMTHMTRPTWSHDITWLSHMISHDMSHMISHDITWHVPHDPTWHHMTCPTWSHMTSHDLRCEAGAHWTLTRGQDVHFLLSHDQGTARKHASLGRYASEGKVNETESKGGKVKEREEVQEKEFSVYRYYNVGGYCEAS